jgi:ferredoxin
MDIKLKDEKKPSGPITSKNWTIHVDRDLCIGAATCVAIAPLTFVMDDEAKAIILETVDEDSQDTILDAARGCPVAAIIIKNEKGEIVFPR